MLSDFVNPPLPHTLFHDLGWMNDTRVQIEHTYIPYICTGTYCTSMQY
jgi:hypothetical protein